jgi:hypothetical protein
MLHRWVGYIVVIQAVLHCLLFLALGIQEHVIGVWQRDRAWIAGSLATVAVALIPVLALGLVRKTKYELFLILHIGATITLLVGAFYHLAYLYNSQNGGYIYYSWITIAFWAFDRLARIVRIAANGIKTAQISIIDKDYIRVDIANAKAYGHAYLYFPTLTPWMFWENHVSRCQHVCPYLTSVKPFSVVSNSTTIDELPEPPPTPLSVFGPVASYRHKRDTSSLFTASPPQSPCFPPHSDLSHPDLAVRGPPAPSPGTPSKTQPTSYFELASPTTPSKPQPSPLPAAREREARVENGITFFLRTHTGMTHRLRSRRRLPVLIEASYGRAPLRLAAHGLRPAQVICVAGGVGITAALPHLRAAASASASAPPPPPPAAGPAGEAGSAEVGGEAPAAPPPPPPPPRLLWGARSAALARALRDDVRPFAARVAVGARMPVAAELRRALAAAAARDPAGAAEVIVVVSGPRAMACEARRVAGEVARGGGGSLRFVDECFGW